MAGTLLEGDTGAQSRKQEGAMGRGWWPDPEQLLRQVPALVDAAVHGHKTLQAWLVSDIRIVKAGVQHDHGKGEHVACVCTTTRHR
jgi:hypothetical protein